MANAAVIRKLLLNYFKKGPRETVEQVLETMFLALSPTEKQTAIDLAKDFLLTETNSDLTLANDSKSMLDSMFNDQSGKLDAAISKLQADLQAIESL